MRRMLLIAVLVLLGAAAPAHAAAVLKLEVRSSRADLVSGDDALVRITVPANAKGLKVKVGKRNVTSAFARRADGFVEGVVTGLKTGRQTLVATLRNQRGARLVITDHPNAGPVFAGPQPEPWKCAAGCDKPPVYSYLYKPALGTGLNAYDPKHPPADVATTTTDQGVKVPFIVRLETGYQDRDQYKIFTLFDPDKPWSRWDPQKQWNHKVFVTHGGDCDSGHASGVAPTNDFSGTIPATPVTTQSYVTALGRGFAVMSTALDNLGHNCNPVTAAESLMMAKERLIEQYGDVRYTIGTGCSGGSIAQQTIANAYPGAVYDGLIITCAYPDAFTALVEFGEDHLLQHYFDSAQSTILPAQWGLIQGRPDPVNGIVGDTAFFSRIPYPGHACVDADVVYNAATRPGGVRCGLFDYLINQLGQRPSSVWSVNEQKVGRGFAGVPFGNVGVQYGLSLLEQGLLTPGQFADLNAGVGGFDVDINDVPTRLSGDDTAVANAYRTGFLNEANNLSGVAILDHAGPDPGAAHDYAHTWWIRDRLQAAQGHLRNTVLWFGPTVLIGDVNWPNEALGAMDKWLAAVERDTSNKTRAQKIGDDRPSDVADRCIGDLCKQYLATRYSSPRQVAGDDERNDIVKCQLKPLVRSDYKVTFSDAEWAKLVAAFPTGVCDWSKPGVGQQGAVPWLTYQDAKGKVITGGKPMGAAPVSTGCRVLRVIRVARSTSVRAVLVNGRRAKFTRTRTGVTLRSAPSGKVRLTLRTRTRAGRARTLRRNYTAC